MSLNTDPYRVKPGSKVRLRKWRPDDDAGLDHDKAEARFLQLRQQLVDLQELLYAQGKHSLLVVFQAMDGGGKDSTIRHVFQGVNPQGCKVASFKSPNDVERRHDFLWRIHQNTPRLGNIGIFNRSHYEDVLVVRVKDLAPRQVWKARYDHINAFEQMLIDEGAAIVKFFLHISKHHQRDRLLRRLANPDKHWKFDPGDLTERERWDQYQEAYETVLSRCSTKASPWYVVPAEKRWFRDLLVTQVLVDTLKGLKMSYPKPTFDPRTITVPD